MRDRIYNRRAARRYAHRSGDVHGRTCWHWFRRPCGHCAWRTITGKNRAAAKAFRARMQVFRDCPHTNTRPNPQATAVLDQNPRVCLGCGIGIVDARRRDFS